MSSILSMEAFEKTLVYVGNLLLFLLVTIIFVPSFLVVTNLQSWWSKKLGELFGF